MQSDSEDEFSRFFRIVPLVLAPLLLAYIWFRPASQPPPKNDSVFGCYTSPNAPKVRLDSKGLQVLQAGFPTIGFHLERLKSGLVLTAESPLRVELRASDYEFAIDRNGIGVFMPFFRVVGDQVYGVLEAGDLEGFRILAQDGRWLPYRPSSSADCQAA
jgi:hypothetical protein